jgi:hypothetical protein
LYPLTSSPNFITFFIVGSFFVLDTIALWGI